MEFLYIIIFFLGLGFGSFSSVIIHRLHTHEKGIFCGRSKCPKCQHTLNAIDLIPLFGYLINRFKCKYCKEPISVTYPILELVMGSAFLMTSVLTGLDKPYLLGFYLLLTFIFVLLSFYDIFFQEIPDQISLPTILITGLGVFFGHLNDPVNMFIGFAVPVSFFSTMFLASKGRWLGGGDIRIGAIMGLLLGWPNIIVGLFLGYLSGSLYSLIGLATGKLGRRSPIPFGPFLFFGAYIALFFGKNILDWYLGMM